MSTLSFGYRSIAHRMMAREPAAYLACRLLTPPVLCRHVMATTWFVCATDDLVDTGPRHDRRQRFAAWEALVRQGATGHCASPRLAAFLHTVAACELPDAMVFGCLDALRADLDFSGLRTEQDYQSYVDEVVFPPAMLIFGVHRAGRDAGFSGTLRLLCESLQRVDILGDLADDLRAGTVFLPAEDLDRVGVSAADLCAGRQPERLLPLLREWTDRADTGLRAVKQLVSQAPADLRPLITTMLAANEMRLASVRRAGLGVVRQRVGAPMLGTLRVALAERKNLCR